MSTLGIQALRTSGIEHEILEYRYVKMGAAIAAEAVGLPEPMVLKSLVFRADDEFLFGLIGAEAHASTRKIGRATGHKHVEAAAPRDAQRVTGYLVGGISPLGARHRLKVLLDETTAENESLVINAGARGTLVRLATKDLVRLTDATICDIRTG